MFRNIGGLELAVILVVLMVLFGAKKIPEFARSLGEAGTEFKKGLHGEDDESEDEGSTKLNQVQKNHPYPPHQPNFNLINNQIKLYIARKFLVL